MFLNPQNITLANSAVAEEIKKQIDIQMEDRVSKHLTFTNVPELLKVIQEIQDPAQQSILLNKYMDMLKEHQKTKDNTLLKLIDSDIQRKDKSQVVELQNTEKILDAEIEKDKLRTELFHNRYFLIFIMCFPIIAGISVLNMSLIFAFYITLLGYGVVLAFYFSQSDALSKLLQNFLIKNQTANDNQKQSDKKEEKK